MFPVTSHQSGVNTTPDMAVKHAGNSKQPMKSQFQTKDLSGGTVTVSPRDSFNFPMNIKRTTPGIQRASSPDWTAKRLYDVVFSFGGLVLLAPLFAMIGALVKIADGGDIFYHQARVGRGGREFLICKFRTMAPAAEQAGPSITKEGDSRITQIGRILRKTKLDELPQLWNVLKGDMSLVGPRPEVPRYVQRYTPAQQEVLRLKPGITDLASLYFRDEEALLAGANNLEEFYLQHCVPRKLQLNLEYAARANLLSDTWIILQTVGCTVFNPVRFRNRTDWRPSLST